MLIEFEAYLRLKNLRHTTNFAEKYQTILVLNTSGYEIYIQTQKKYSGYSKVNFHNRFVLHSYFPMIYSMLTVILYSS
jgi:hypothetical protein